MQPNERVRTLRDVTAAPEADSALWALSLTGNGEAFGVLFDRHRDRLFGHALRLVDNREDAEDLVAAAFLELWRKRDHVRLANGSVVPWLLVTVTNLSRNLARGRRRHRAVLARLPRDQTAPDAADVVAAGLPGIDPRLRAAMRELAERDLQLFVLVALEDCSLGDAASVLGLSVSAAKSRLHRARARMRELLGGDPQYANYTMIGGR